MHYHVAKKHHHHRRRCCYRHQKRKQVNDVKLINVMKEERDVSGL